MLRATVPVPMLLLLAAAPAPPAPDPASPARLALSLVDALPSPVPSTVLPRMPAPTVGTPIFKEDFEHGAARWRMAGGQGDVGWHHLRAVACGGRYTMVLGRPHNEPFAGVATHADLTLVRPLDLARAHHPHLQYDLKGLTRPYDLVTVRPQVRRPGGAWQPIGAPGHARYQTVVTFTADLTPFAGGPLELRFAGDVRASQQPNRGLYLDDVVVLEPRR